jgi:hypothetical protein
VVVRVVSAAGSRPKALAEAAPAIRQALEDSRRAEEEKRIRLPRMTLRLFDGSSNRTSAVVRFEHV